MCEVIEFKTRSELLSDWIKEVINRNGLLEQDVQSALLLWEKKGKRWYIYLYARKIQLRS